MDAVLGIDISQDTFDVVLQSAAQAGQHRQFENEPAGFRRLFQFLTQEQATTAHACMEATGVYYEALAIYLHEQQCPVSVVNPALIKAYGQSQLRRNKTDKLDAATIADFCRTQRPPRWTPPDKMWYELRALVRHLDDLMDDRQRQRNRQATMQRMAHPSPTVLAHLAQQLELLCQQIEAVKQHIQAHIARHPDLKQQQDLLISIKGIGALTAARLLAEYYGFTTFDNVRQVVAFAGLNPRQRQSGTSIQGRTRISKMGRASIRAALYLPAVNAKRFNPLLQPFVQRLEARGLSGTAIVVAVMRKLLHLAFGVLKSGQPFDSHYLENRAAMA